MKKSRVALQLCNLISTTNPVAWQRQKLVKNQKGWKCCQNAEPLIKCCIKCKALTIVPLKVLLYNVTRDSKNVATNHLLQKNKDLLFAVSGRDRIMRFFVRLMSLFFYDILALNCRKSVSRSTHFIGRKSARGNKIISVDSVSDVAKDNNQQRTF